MTRSFWWLAMGALVACGDGRVAAPGTPPPDIVHQRFDVVGNPPSESGQESYLCFVLDGTSVAGGHVTSLTWSTSRGPVAVHHATLYALPDALPLGAVDCGRFPSTPSVLHVYTPGSALTLPEGVALQIAPNTQRLEVELHLFRTAPGDGPPIGIDLGLLAGEPEHLAAWVDDYAPVPPLVPHVRATETGLCRFPASGRIVSSWPHMHQAGASFTGTIVRANGTREPLVEVPTWDFHHQPMYPLDVAFEAGDSVETSCTWVNTTEQIIFPGSFSFQEMCNQGLYVWPPDAARCAP
jgi:hypothetical protein